MYFQNLASTCTISTSFDFWMSRGGVDIFSLVIKFLNESWTPMHVTMGLFESLLSKFGLVHHMITFVKDEGNNLTSIMLHH
jgi:hypothetical protein